MPDIKCSMFINGTAQGLSTGWSESYYQVASSLTTALTSFEEICRLRALCLGKDADLVAYRVSNVLIRGDSQIAYPAVGKFKTSELDMDSPWQSFLWRLQSGDLYRSMHHFRGIPDTAMQPGEKDHMDIRKAFGIMIQSLKDQKYSIQITPRGIDLPAVKIVTAIFTFATSTVDVQTVGAHGLLATNKVRIRGTSCTNDVILNGTYQVLTVTDATHFSIHKPGFPNGTIYIKGGDTQKISVGYANIDSNVFVRLSHKKTGRAYGSTRGRVARRK